LSEEVMGGDTMPAGMEERLAALEASYASISERLGAIEQRLTGLFMAATFGGLLSAILVTR
jgi:hypothetical protein